MTKAVFLCVHLPHHHLHTASTHTLMARIPKERQLRLQDVLSSIDLWLKSLAPSGDVALGIYGDFRTEPLIEGSSSVRTTKPRPLPILHCLLPASAGNQESGHTFSAIQKQPLKNMCQINTTLNCPCRHFTIAKQN